MAGNDEQLQPQPFSNTDLMILRMTDGELSQSIARRRNEINTLGPILPDKGNKLRSILKRCEEEMEHRELQHLQKMSDDELSQSIARKRNEIDTLSDKGAKLQAALKCCEEELLRRELRRFQEMSDDELRATLKHCEKELLRRELQRLEKMSDDELSLSIARRRNVIDTLGPRLPDKGAKLRAALKRCEEERLRRKRILKEEDFWSQNCS